MATTSTNAPPTAAVTEADATTTDSRRRQEAVAAEARALLEAGMREIVEGWRAAAAADGVGFDPAEDVLVVLSGGVDSSLTFHLAASLYGVRHCITLLADAGEAATDAPWCRAVAEHVEAKSLRPRGLTLDHEVRVSRVWLYL